jgi:uncharacterized membrane protein
MSMNAPLAETADDRTDENNDRYWVGLAYIAFPLGYFNPAIALLSVIIAYVRKDSAPAWLETHYVSQIQTFWRGFIVLIIGFIGLIAIMFTALDLGGFDMTSLAAFGVGGGIIAIGITLLWIWVLVRSISGISRLLNQQKVDKPYGYWI